MLPQLQKLWVAYTYKNCSKSVAKLLYLHTFIQYMQGPFQILQWLLLLGGYFTQCTSQRLPTSTIRSKSLQFAAAGLVIGSSALFTTPVGAFSGLDIVKDVYKVKISLDFTLINIDNTPIAQVFDQIDFFLNEFSLRRKLQLMVATASDDYRNCVQGFRCLISSVSVLYYYLTVILRFQSPPTKQSKTSLAR